MSPAAVFARQLFAAYRGQTVPREVIERHAGVRFTTVVGLLEIVGVQADAKGRAYTFPAA